MGSKTYKTMRVVAVGTGILFALLLVGLVVRNYQFFNIMHLFPLHKVPILFKYTLEHVCLAAARVLLNNLPFIISVPLGVVSLYLFYGQLRGWEIGALASLSFIVANPFYAPDLLEYLIDSAATTTFFDLPLIVIWGILWLFLAFLYIFGLLAYYDLRNKEEQSMSARVLMVVGLSFCIIYSFVDVGFSVSGILGFLAGYMVLKILNRIMSKEAWLLYYQEHGLASIKKDINHVKKMELSSDDNDRCYRGNFYHLFDQLRRSFDYTVDNISKKLYDMPFSALNSKWKKYCVGAVYEYLNKETVFTSELIEEDKHMMTEDVVMLIDSSRFNENLNRFIDQYHFGIIPEDLKPVENIDETEDFFSNVYYFSLYDELHRIADDPYLMVLIDGMYGLDYEFGFRKMDDEEMMDYYVITKEELHETRNYIRQVFKVNN